MSGIIELCGAILLSCSFLKKAEHLLFRCARSSRYFEKLKASIQNALKLKTMPYPKSSGQVVEVKKAEQLFKEAREISATVQW